MKKILFFDADGTVIHNNVISEQTKETLRLLKEQGVITVLCTGRALPSILGPLAELELDHMICSGGATVVVNNEVVYTRPMPLSQQQEVSDYLSEQKVFYNMEANDHIYVKKGELAKLDEHFYLPYYDELTTQEQDTIQRIKRMTLERTREVEDLSTIKVNKFHYFVPKHLGDESLSFEKVKEDLGNRFNCVQLSLSKLFGGAEINEYGITKQNGVEVCLDYFGIDHANSYAIGDDYNDVEMLRYVACGIAMGNAPQDIKELADVVTLDIKDEGFTHAMKMVGLLK